MSVLPCVNKKTWTLAPSRSTWKTSRLFFSRGKIRWPAIFSKNFRYLIQRNYSRPLPDNKPKNRDFSSTLLSVVVVLWRMERMLRLVLLSACVTVVTHGCWTTLLSASPQPNLMLILEPATWTIFPSQFSTQDAREHFKFECNIWIIYTMTLIKVGSTFEGNFCQET